MATYSTKKILAANASQIDDIAEAIVKDFRSNDFDVNVDTLMSGGKDISITKGDMFKAVMGLRSALKITLMPQLEGVMFEANVGIFGQQVIPTIISMFVFWPVLFTQIWGLVEQAALDDRALEVAENAIATAPVSTGVHSNGHKFCTNCGAKIDSSASFCSECGAKNRTLR